MDNTVVLASRLPKQVKDKVKKFAKLTKRNMSQSVHFLLDSHPLLQVPENKELQTANTK